MSKIKQFHANLRLRHVLSVGGLDHQTDRGGASEGVLSDAACKKNVNRTVGPKITH